MLTPITLFRGNGVRQDSIVGSLWLMTRDERKCCEDYELLLYAFVKCQSRVNCIQRLLNSMITLFDYKQQVFNQLCYWREH